MRPREVPGFLRWKTLAHWLLAAMQGLIPPGARGNLTAYNQLLLKKQLEPTVLVALFEKRVEKKQTLERTSHQMSDSGSFVF